MRAVLTTGAAARFSEPSPRCPPEILRLVHFLPTGDASYGQFMDELVRYQVTVATGTVEVDGADAYAPDGALTTFYRCRDGRHVIDAWATRVASFRTADILRIVRVDAVSRALVA